LPSTPVENALAFVRAGQSAQNLAPIATPVGAPAGLSSGAAVPSSAGSTVHVSGPSYE
jgi:hypothetical protein